MEQTVKKRKLQAIETKQKIFEATMELIEEKGIENVQIEDISRKANVSMGLFYKYFANISDVITEATDKKADTNYLAIKQMYLEGLRGEEKLLCFIWHVADYHQKLKKEDLKHSYATMLSKPMRRQSLTNETRPIYTILGECISEMIEDGVLSSDISADTTARYLIILIRGTIYEYLMIDDRFDIIEISKHLVGTYLDGLKPR